MSHSLRSLTGKSAGNSVVLGCLRGKVGQARAGAGLGLAVLNSSALGVQGKQPVGGTLTCATARQQLATTRRGQTPDAVPQSGAGNRPVTGSPGWTPAPSLPPQR